MEESKNGGLLQSMLFGGGSGGGSGGGCEEFLVTFVAANGEQESPTCDKTLAQISSAYAAGKKIVGRVIFPDDLMTYDNVPVALTATEDSVDAATFTMLASAGVTQNNIVIRWVYADIQKAKGGDSEVTVELRVTAVT